MRTETTKAWWRQLNAMSQGMLFLEGHIASVEALPEDVRRPCKDAAARRRHERAIERLSARRLRAMTALSLFR